MDKTMTLKIYSRNYEGKYIRYATMPIKLSDTTPHSAKIHATKRARLFACRPMQRQWTSTQHGHGQIIRHFENLNSDAVYKFVIIPNITW